MCLCTVSWLEMLMAQVLSMLRWRSLGWAECMHLGGAHGTAVSGSIQPTTAVEIASIGVLLLLAPSYASNDCRHESSQGCRPRGNKVFMSVSNAIREPAYK